MRGGAWRTAALFAREWLRHPAGVGALCPSSAGLARALARAVPADSGLIIELGGGTGAVTQALLDQGVEPRRLLVVERSAAFARHLLARFPCVRVIQGNAALLDRLLPARTHAGAVVCCLPLYSLPREECAAILAQCHRILGERGVMARFSYDLRTPDPGVLSQSGFSCVASHIVWGNLPPARIQVVRKQAFC